MGDHQFAWGRILIGKSKMQRIVLWVMAADSPLLYFSTMSGRDEVWAVIALAVMAAAAIVASIVF